MSELNVYKHIRYATAWRCFCSRNLLYGIIFVAVMVQIKNDMIKIHQFTEADTIAARDIWNTVVRDGIAFPQDEELTDNAEQFFKSQSYTGIAVDDNTGEIVGLYILHPNNVGRCGHICNTSYAVKEGKRGLHIGEQLVLNSMQIGKELGYRILQFNAVVATNTHALHLYQRLGFTQLGVIPQGFRMKDGHYEDIIPHYIKLI